VVSSKRPRLALARAADDALSLVVVSAEHAWSNPHHPHSHSHVGVALRDAGSHAKSDFLDQSRLFGARSTRPRPRVAPRWCGALDVHGLCGAACGALLHRRAHRARHLAAARPTRENKRVDGRPHEAAAEHSAAAVW